MEVAPIIGSDDGLKEGAKVGVAVEYSDGILVALVPLLCWTPTTRIIIIYTMKVTHEQKSQEKH